MSDSTQRFDLAVGIVGLLAFPPVIATLIYSQLPCTRLRELEETVANTEGLLQQNTEAGLLGPHADVAKFHNRLNLLRDDIEDVRAESHCATTYVQNVRKMLEGLSRRISAICMEVKKLRADISTTTARERERLRQSQASTANEAHIGRETGSSACETTLASVDCPYTVTVSPSSTPLRQANAGTAEVHYPVDAVEPPSPTPPHWLNSGSATRTGRGGTPSASRQYFANQALSLGPDPMSVQEPNSPGIFPEDLEGHHILPLAGSRSSLPRNKRYGYGKSRIHILSRLLRGIPSRRHSSSSSTRGLMLIPSQTLASIELASDNDDPEWEDIAVRKVLPV